MIYEILNYIKSKGCINSGEVIQILNKFEDLNSPDEIQKCTEKDYLKYVKFGIEALSETVDREKEGRYNLNKSKNMRSS